MKRGLAEQSVVTSRLSACDEFDEDPRIGHGAEAVDEETRLSRLSQQRVPLLGACSVLIVTRRRWGGPA